MTNIISFICVTDSWSREMKGKGKERNNTSFVLIKRQRNREVLWHTQHDSVRHVIDLPNVLLVSASVTGRKKERSVYLSIQSECIFSQTSSTTCTLITTHSLSAGGKDR